VKPLRLRATNFRTYETIDQTFEGGLMVILGNVVDAPDGIDSNGAGKSSILEAIDIALFGRRSLQPFLTRGGDVTELMLELTFEHAGETYRVRRSFSARTKAGKTTCDFEHLVGGPMSEGEIRVDVDVQGAGWEPLTCSSGKETDSLIVDTIGLTRDTYRASGYLRQRADPFRDPKEWQELLAEAGLGRDPVWPRAQKAAKTARLEAQNGLERLAGETRAARELADTKPDVEREHFAAFDAQHDAEHLLEIAEAELQAVSERYLAAKDGAARRATCEAEFAGARGLLEALTVRTANADAAARQIVEANAALEQLPAATRFVYLDARRVELEQKRAEYREQATLRAQAQTERDRCKNERVELRAMAGALNDRAAGLRTLADQKRADEYASCQTCGQPIADAAKDQALDELARLAVECETKAQECDVKAATLAILVADGDTLLAAAAVLQPPDETEYASIVAQITAANAAQTQRATLAERIAHLQTTAASGPSPDELAAAQQTVTTKQAELDDIEPVNLAAIEAAGTAARTHVAQNRSQLDVAKTTRARLDERLAAVGRAAIVIASAAIQETELHAQIDVETVIEKACGRDGIPTLIIEGKVIPYLETEAARILSLLGIGFRVEMHTQAERKDGSGLRDTFEVVVIDRDGNEAEFEDGTSGGEQTRIGFVLQVALAEYMALAGRGSRLLAVDEPPYLDRSGALALVRVLEEFIARGVFDLILAVSHDADMRDSFEDTILVVNEGGRSRIEGAVVLEEVAA